MRTAWGSYRSGGQLAEKGSQRYNKKAGSSRRLRDQMPSFVRMAAGMACLLMTMFIVL